MKTSHLILACAVGVASVGMYLYTNETSAQFDILGATSNHQASAAAGHATASSNPTSNATTLAIASDLMPLNPAQASPFGSSNANTDAMVNNANNSTAAASSAPEPEVVPPAEAERRKKMKQLGYMVPTEYYLKDLATLKQMAKNGDAYAMVHLGEKYYFELNGSKQNPEFDPNMDYGSAARLSFSQALAAGNVRSAAIIAETYLQENNKVDAYAWHLLSEQLGDSISADWFKSTKTYSNLTAEEKQAGRAKLPELIANVNELGKKMNLKPIFSKAI